MRHIERQSIYCPGARLNEFARLLRSVADVCPRHAWPIGHSVGCGHEPQHPCYNEPRDRDAFKNSNEITEIELVTTRHFFERYPKQQYCNCNSNYEYVVFFRPNPCVVCSFRPPCVEHTGSENNEGDEGHFEVAPSCSHYFFRLLKQGVLCRSPVFGQFDFVTVLIHKLSEKDNNDCGHDREGDEVNAYLAHFPPP